VASERIKSLVSGFCLPDEVDPEVAKQNPAMYDVEAWSRIERGEYEEEFKQVILKLHDDIVRLQIPEYLKLFREISGAINAMKVARNYAYMAVADAEKNMFYLRYSSSFKYYERFEKLITYYTQLINSLNDMLWDTIKYIEYKATEYRVEEVKNKVYQFYSRIPAKYLDVVVYDDEVIIYTAAQLIGRIIGKKGSTINQIQQQIGRKIRVYEYKYLTSIYSEEHPEIPKDPEVLKMVGEVIRLLGELERKGVTVQQILKMKEEMLSPDDYRVEEGETW
jgi:hypothetical protein